MEKHETRAAGSLAAIFSVRLLGLFMIYPVFATYAKGLDDVTPYKIGLALGIYGLTQGLLQIPFGLLSDRIGRKVMIVLGLVLFGIGSAVAALSTSIDGIIIGRAIQGGGAVGSVILACVADLTAEENRTKAMALVGITIGLSFMIAVVAGPVIAGFVGVAGIFWLMAILAAIGVAITLFVVPSPRRITVHRDAETVPALFRTILRDPELLRLDFGIFSLHAMLTASFLVIPGLLGHSVDVTSHEQWIVYLPVLVVSVLVMVPAIIVGEKQRRMKAVLVAAIIALGASQVMLAAGPGNLYVVLAAITLFFSGFNVMEASLPSLVTKTAPPDAKGTATGIYSSSQFLGIFIGGVVGGWAHQAGGVTTLFALTAALAVLWLIAAATMKPPSYLATRLIRLDGQAPQDAEDLAARLRQVPGVAEAVVIAEDGLAYLKVDSKAFDEAKAEALAQAG
ncbi:MAG TPA: MFS transporter [Pararhizobium sp.]|nr:MFS transporter [Pararhizobium sp.]